MTIPEPDPPRQLATTVGHWIRPGRRGFLAAAAGSLAGLTGAGLAARIGWAQESVIVEMSDGLLVADPTRCVGCRRCELACTEALDGRAQPSLARIKVGRNYNFGPRGQQRGMGRGPGEFGNLLIIPDACLQCPHPVPCATACLHDAFELEPRTKARVVNESRCQGCRACLRACPWEMMTFDDSRAKALKCTLCAGEPVCVEACPASALQFVRWRDLTTAVPVRQAVVASRGFDHASCAGCHRVKR